MPIGSPLHDNQTCPDPDWSHWGYTSYPVQKGRICSKCAAWELQDAPVDLPR